jgi:adenine-specific DNA-methyltransferase
LWGPDEAGTNDDAKRHLMTMFPELEAFATPKPEALLERIIHIASDPMDLVVDFFAGSGTTAAVAHKMQRRWIAIERSPSTAAAFTVPRLALVVHGTDPGGITGSANWRGGGAFVIGTVGDSGALAPEISDAIRNPRVRAAIALERSTPEVESARRAEAALRLFDDEPAVGDGVDVA